MYELTLKFNLGFYLNSINNYLKNLQRLKKET